MKIYKGKAGAPGIAAAKVLYYGAKAGGGEKLGIDGAVAKALERVGALKQKAYSHLGGDKAKIFDAYEMRMSPRHNKTQERWFQFQILNIICRNVPFNMMNSNKW